MPSAVSLIRSLQLAPAEYAHAASAAPGARLIFLAGACPVEPDGRTSAPGDVGAQAARCLANLDIALDAAGASRRDVVQARVLVASSDRADLHLAWSVVHHGFADHEVPSTLMGVTVLGYPDQLVEIEAIAAVVG
ncbi:Rid family hydrolase [Microbacterium sp. 10M-3C3]|jgi:enamine deaminase RidA (YjgF/YER057c/UK114 family)|uniref:RidA family protein n=1 Tax=Microbacterium sp. 10M-3C3 TaxID=2483401 RepID=UPI000F63C1D9|nr:Rid family hydrolase [Microbacterium sp. 10M-3C3]